MQRLKGFLNLVFDTIGETTNLVERTHLTVAKRSVSRFVPAGPASTAAEAVNDLHDTVASGAYESIRVVNRGVQALFNIASDAAISQVDIPAHWNQGKLATPSHSNTSGSFRSITRNQRYWSPPRRPSATRVTTVRRRRTGTISAKRFRSC